MLLSVLFAAALFGFGVFGLEAQAEDATTTPETRSAAEAAGETALPSDSEAATALRAKIDERNRAIDSLEKEIASYQVEIEKVGKETQSLSSTLRSLELERKKFLAEIKVTETKIANAANELERLAGNITLAEGTMKRYSRALREGLRRLYAEESETLLEALLAHPSLGAFWDEMATLERATEFIQSGLTDVKAVKETLVNKHTAVDKKKKELEGLRRELSDRKKIVEYNQKEKNKLLATTKNKEANFKRILNEKIALREAFEQELLEFESELKLQIDASRLPKTGSGVLAWPLDAVKITQRFGTTAFAAAHRGLYGGVGHNGVDLRASVGTKVKAALGGRVVGTGDTDTVCSGASYGKWVLVEHDNGLSTLYAHLSLIRAAAGEALVTGDTVGYSGNTGYSTGPHLHFTVYATQGVKIISKRSRVCNGTYTMPIADPKAYLNPLSYL
ncbi:MAG: peptidase M23 [Parcubacteria group bacterium Gr01-1014_72]|nr:MAG: peptidase M23 [Parcubacteria group bacterium Gr01-1014_72]